MRLPFPWKTFSLTWKIFADDNTEYFERSEAAGKGGGSGFFYCV